MKRALALVGAMMALLAISTGTASAQAPCTNADPAYCPASSSPSTSPTVDPPAATTAVKDETAASITDSVGKDVTFETQVGSTLVYAIDGAGGSSSSSGTGGSGTTPSGLFPIGVLALTSETGAKVETQITFKLDNGKTLSVPSPTKTIGPGGELIVKIRLTKSQLKALQAAGGGTASIAITVTDQFGTHQQTVKVEVAAPAKKKKSKK
jgi:hypothetical protein